MRMKALGVACHVALTIPALAQPGIPGWNIEVIGGPVSPSNPSVTVRVSARFPTNDYAFAAGALDVVSSEAGWSNPVMQWVHLGTPGRPEGPRVSLIEGLQINWPPVIIPWTANPLPFWEATWTATSFDPRAIRVESVTKRFDVFERDIWPFATSRLALLHEGRAEFHVIPAPASLVVTYVSLFYASRRARSARPER